MKILHTADLHLTACADDRWQGLEQLIQTGIKENINLLVICGDLFDRAAELVKLQNRVRALFSGLPYKVILLPGNHDYHAYRKGLYLGENVEIVSDWRRSYRFGNIQLRGLPFEPVSAVEIYSRLYEMAADMDKKLYQVLLYHGELIDAFFARQEMGDEGPDRYMPVKLLYFQELPFDCVLAGHFHSSYRIWNLEQDRYFVYSGSPVSITRRETGQRACNLLAVGKPPLEVKLDTFHYEERTLRLDPFSGLDPLEQVTMVLNDRHPNAKLLLTVAGFIDGSNGTGEKELVEKINSITYGLCAEEPRYQFNDIQIVLTDDLFIRFQSKLESMKIDSSVRERWRELALRAFMEAGIC